MNLADAEKEFRLREYVWAKAEWEKEINESFPHLRMFKTGHAWDIYQFMQKLNKEEQLALAMGRLKKRSPELASKCGEHLSEKEELLYKKFDTFWRIKDKFQTFKCWLKEKERPDADILFEMSCAYSVRLLCDTDSSDYEFLISELNKYVSSIPQSFEEQVKDRKLAGEKIKFVSKKKLQKIVTQKFKNVFENQYEECRVNEGYAGCWTMFDMKCAGWMLKTQFIFGRKPGYQQSVFEHRHEICSQKKILRPAISEYAIPEFMDPIAHLSTGVRWPCSSEWEYLTEEDVELACEETFKHCRYFFEAAPKLLHGLDVEGISEN